MFSTFITLRVQLGTCKVGRTNSGIGFYFRLIASHHRTRFFNDVTNSELEELVQSARETISENHSSPRFACGNCEIDYTLGRIYFSRHFIVPFFIAEQA